MNALSSALIVTLRSVTPTATFSMLGGRDRVGASRACVHATLNRWTAGKAPMEVDIDLGISPLINLLGSCSGNQANRRLLLDHLVHRRSALLWGTGHHSRLSPTSIRSLNRLQRSPEGRSMARDTDPAWLGVFLWCRHCRLCTAGGKKDVAVEVETSGSFKRRVTCVRDRSVRI